MRSIGRWLGGGEAVWTGESATEEAFRAAVAEGARVIHLATHTVFDDRPGAGAAVVLSPGAGDDGLLRPEEIAALEVGADLTVLAACQTAIGDGSGASAHATLTGAFLIAGSSAVVATLWQVGDAASAAFMDQLYYQLSRGLAPAAALREAKLRMKESADWSHPGLWSAYVLVGRGVALPHRFPIALLLWGLGALAVAALLWWARIRSRR